MKKQWLSNIILAIITSTNMICPAFAQGADNESGSNDMSSAQQSKPELWRGKPPALPGPRPFKLPEVISYKLANGLSVQLLPDHRVPFVTAALGFKVGSAIDPPKLLGLAGMTADMLTEGTSSLSSKQIADEIDFIGGGLHAGADSDNTIISGSALSQYTPRLFEIFADILLHPSFPADELKLKRTNLIQELEIKRSEPEFLVDERFAKEVFANHPYSVVAPTPETVAKLRRADLQQFHRNNYGPRHGYLVVVGDFELDKMKALIEKQFANNWKEYSVQQATMPPVEAKKAGKSIYLVDRPGSVQSSIKLGNVSIAKTDPDYFPFLVANQILGGATNSRLFLNIREQKGYTYGAYSGIDARRLPGAFCAEAEVRTDVTAPSLQEFLYELDRLRNVKVSNKELADAKAHMVGSFQLGLETQSALVSRLLERKLYDLPSDYLETYVDKLMAVTPDQVRAMARKHIDLDNMTICVVGDAKKIKPDLEYFAKLNLYDTNGKLLSKDIALKNHQ